MIKSLVSDPRVFEALENARPTAPSRRHAVASVVRFYFDFSAETGKGSLTALLRSLLWQTLKQVPGYSTVVLPKLQMKKNTEGNLIWTESELLQFFESIVQQQDDILLCVFVDALDEYQGRDIDIANFFDRICTLAPRKLRLCLSSRPYPDFLYQFKSYHSILLEEGSRANIERYTINKLGAAESLEDWQLDWLVEAIVHKAKGVFLWVKVVTAQLCSRHRRLEEFDRLQNRLNELPQEMMAMYQRTLSDMDSEDRTELLKLCRILLVAKYCSLRKDP